MKKKLVFLLTIAAFLLMFTACGGYLDTTVTLNDDLSGSRVMKYTIPKSDFDEYVSGDINAVNETVAANVPEGLSYSLAEDESNYIATFTMNFSSLEDAAAKASALINDGSEYEINFAVGESVFSTGFVYEEGWYTESLMSWFETLMVNSGYVSSGDQSYIIESSTSRVSFKGETIECDSKVYASTMDYIPIENVRIFTDVNPDGTYNRKIELDISDANLKLKEDEIKAFMEKSIPANAKGEWTADLGMNTHTVTIENVSAEEMQAAMRTYSHGDKATFATAQPDEEGVSAVLLAENACFDEYLDMAAYGCNSYGSVRVYYYLNRERLEGNLKMNISTDESGEETFQTPYADWDETYSAYNRYDFYDIRESQIAYDGQYYYHFGNVEWNTVVKSEKKITRDIVLVFDDGTSEEQGKLIEERIEAYVAESEEKLGIDVSTELTEEAFTSMTIRLEGNAQEISDAYAYLTGYQHDDDIICVEEDRWIGFTKDCVFSETVHTGGLLGPTFSTNEYWDIPLKYTLDMPGGEPVWASYTDSVYDADEGLIIVETNAPGYNPITAQSTKFAPMGLVFIFILLASIVFFFIGVACIVLGIMKKAKNKGQNAAPAANAVKEETKAPEVKNEGVKAEDIISEMAAAPITETPAGEAADAQAPAEETADTQAPAEEAADAQEPAEEVPATEETNA